MTARERNTLLAQLGTEWTMSRPAAVGGMGTIYEGVHLRSGRRVAVKVLHAHLEDNPEAVARFEQEVRIGALMDHPNLVRTHGVHRDAHHRVYLVTEWMEGETLEARLRRGPCQLGEAMRIVSGLCSGLAAAHHAGVIHRDIKPDNVFLARTDRGVMPKLFDFGIAHLRACHLTRRGMFLGTPAYMSPEQCAGEPQVSERTDVRALGLLFYEMATGRNPFRGATALESVILVCSREVPSTPLLPPPIFGVIRRATALRMEERFACAKDFLAALRKAAKGLGALPTDMLSTAKIEQPASCGRQAPEKRGTRRTPEGRRGIWIPLLLLVNLALGVILWRSW